MASLPKIRQRRLQRYSHLPSQAAVITESGSPAISYAAGPVPQTQKSHPAQYIKAQHLLFLQVYMPLSLKKRLQAQPGCNPLQIRYNPDQNERLHLSYCQPLSDSLRRNQLPDTLEFQQSHRSMPLLHLFLMEGFYLHFSAVQRTVQMPS